MQWPELCLRLVLALSLQSAAGFLSPLPFLPRQNPVAGTPAGHSPAGSSSTAAAFARRSSTAAPTARRLPLQLLRSPGPQLPRPRCSRHPCGLSAAAPPAALGGRGVRRERSRTATSSSNTALAARTGDGGLQRDSGGGGEGAEKGGGWRQRVVRTVVSVFLRIRAVVAALGSRLGLGRWSKVSCVCWQASSCVTA